VAKQNDVKNHALTNSAIIILTFFITIYIHRKTAKCAENINFMLAVDPPKIPADRKDGKHKGQFVQQYEIPYA